MTGEARDLICPNCGACVGFCARLCEHCQAELATIRCGQCFSLELVGSKVCAQCGATLGLEGVVGAMGISCPRCSDTELTGAHVGEYDVGECMRCTGLFVEHPVFERITRRAEERAGMRLRPLAPKPSEAEARAAYLKCPRCASLMSRKNFGERSGVIVDVCGAHGVWFDRDELAQVIDFVDGGGLSRIRERDARAQAIKRLGENARLPDVGEHGSYDMVGSFLRSVFLDR